jgi:hypothetical protein
LLETWTSWRLQWQLLPAFGDFEKIQSEMGDESDRTREALLKGTFDLLVLTILDQLVFLY